MDLGDRSEWSERRLDRLGREIRSVGKRVFLDIAGIFLFDKL